MAAPSWRFFVHPAAERPFSVFRPDTNSKIWPQDLAARSGLSLVGKVWCGNTGVMRARAITGFDAAAKILNEAGVTLGAPPPMPDRQRLTDGDKQCRIP
jgi:hypothetical protein